MKWMLFLLLVSSCASGRYMTKNSFELVTVGSHIRLIEEQYGNAYDVEDCQQGIKKYRYIERISTGPGVTEHLHYIFLVGPNGHILQKRIESVGGIVDLRINQ